MATVVFNANCIVQDIAGEPKRRTDTIRHRLRIAYFNGHDFVAHLGRKLARRTERYDLTTVQYRDAIAQCRLFHEVRC